MARDTAPVLKSRLQSRLGNFLSRPFPRLFRLLSFQLTVFLSFLFLSFSPGQAVSNHNVGRGNIQRYGTFGTGLTLFGEGSPFGPYIVSQGRGRIEGAGIYVFYSVILLSLFLLFLLLLSLPLLPAISIISVSLPRDIHARNTATNTDARRSRAITTTTTTTAAPQPLCPGGVIFPPPVVIVGLASQSAKLHSRCAPLHRSGVGHEETWKAA